MKTENMTIVTHAFKEDHGVSEQMRRCESTEFQIARAVDYHQTSGRKLTTMSQQSDSTFRIPLHLVFYTCANRVIPHSCLHSLGSPWHVEILMNFITPLLLLLSRHQLMYHSQNCQIFDKTIGSASRAAASVVISRCIYNPKPQALTFTLNLASTIILSFRHKACMINHMYVIRTAPKLISANIRY